MPRQLHDGFMTLQGTNNAFITKPRVSAGFAVIHMWQDSHSKEPKMKRRLNDARKHPILTPDWVFSRAVIDKTQCPRDRAMPH